MNVPHIKLSKTKVAYTRPGEENTLLIREQNLDKKKYTAFGAKGCDQLTKMYYAMLSLLKLHQKNIFENSKFQPHGLEHFLESLTEGDAQKISDIGLFAHQAEIRVDQVQLRMIVDGHPRMGFFLFDSTGGSVPLTGIYLFVSEVTKLVKFMNEQYNIGETHFTCFHLYDTDDFIDL